MTRASSVDEGGETGWPKDDPVKLFPHVCWTFVSTVEARSVSSRAPPGHSMTDLVVTLLDGFEYHAEEQEERQLFAKKRRAAVFSFFEEEGMEGSFLQERPATDHDALGPCASEWEPNQRRDSRERGRDQRTSWGLQQVSQLSE